MTYKVSKSFGAAKAKLAHMVDGKGGVPGEVVDLRKDVEAGFIRNEARVGFPVLYALDGGAVAAAGGDAVLIGYGLLQGQTFDSIVLHGTGDATLTITCMAPGKSGTTVEIGTPAGGGVAVTADTSGRHFTITPAAGGSTVAAMATAVNLAAAASHGIIRAVSAGTGNFTAAAPAAALTGGDGVYSGNVVMFGNLICLPKHATGTSPTASWTDTSITVEVPAFSGHAPALVAGDIVVAMVAANGIVSNTLSFAIGA